MKLKFILIITLALITFKTVGETVGKNIPKSPNFKFAFNLQLRMSGEKNSLFTDSVQSPINHELTDEIKVLTFLGEPSVKNYTEFGANTKVYFPKPYSFYLGGGFFIGKKSIKHDPYNEPKYRTEVQIEIPQKLELNILGGYSWEFFDGHRIVFGGDFLIASSSVDVKIIPEDTSSTTIIGPNSYSMPLKVTGFKIHGGYEFVYSSIITNLNFFTGSETWTLSNTENTNLKSGSVSTYGMILSGGYLLSP